MFASLTYQKWYVLNGIWKQRKSTNHPLLKNFSPRHTDPQLQIEHSSSHHCFSWYEYYNGNFYGLNFFHDYYNGNFYGLNFFHGYETSL